MEPKLILGISSCLLGHKVRYDGGHKYDSWLVETLGNYVDYVPVCPEVGCGLPIPREAMRLVGEASAPRLITQKTLIDHTDRMQQFCRAEIENLRSKGLCGYIFKSKSPSSGMERVKVYPQKGELLRKPGLASLPGLLWMHFPYFPLRKKAGFTIRF